MSEPLDLDLLSQIIDLLEVCGYAPRAAIEPHSTLTGDLGISMVARSSLTMDIFDVYGVALPHSEWSEWQTVADMVRSVAAHGWSGAA